MKPISADEMEVFFISLYVFFLIKLDAHTVTQMLSRGRLRRLYINVFIHFHLSWKLLRVCSCVVASGGELSAKKIALCRYIVRKWL